jgi:hypothetical protein
MLPVFVAAMTAAMAVASERANRTQAYIALVEQYRVGDRKSAVEDLPHVARRLVKATSCRLRQ